jgi:hypothetical protein
MPGALTGTIALDSDNKQIKGYNVSPAIPFRSDMGNIEFGDVNNDGYITSTDYALVQRYILGMISKTGFKNANTGEVYIPGYLAGDVDATHISDPTATEYLTSTDLAYIKRAILGMINIFPIEEQYIN